MNAVTSDLQARRTSMPIPESHFVTGAELKPPFPAGLETAVFGMGCFWGVDFAWGASRCLPMGALFLTMYCSLAVRSVEFTTLN